MAFVNELIPEEQKVRLTQLPVMAKSNVQLWKWTIDIEREIALFECMKWGGGYEGTPEDCQMVLDWQGEQATFWAEQTFKAHAGRPPLLIQSVREIFLPPTFSHSSAQVMAVIQEALLTRGWHFGSRGISGVEVKFI